MSRRIIFESSAFADFKECTDYSFYQFTECDRSQSSS